MLVVIDPRDIPQAPRLARVRRVVETARGGSTTIERTMAAAAMKRRDANYYLRGAASLGLLARDGDRYSLEDLGRRLIATAKSSEDERQLLREAIGSSAIVRALAGDLLAYPGPTRASIAREIRRAGLGASTASQRAGALLGWRSQVEKPRLPYRSDAAEQAVIRDSASAPAPVPARAPLGRPVLASLEIVDFKSFASATIPLTDFTLFVGANGSGKSNALDAIRCLQGVALDLTIADVLRGRVEGGRELWPAIRGGIAEACRYGRDQFDLTSRWNVDGHELTHSIGCTVSTVPLVRAEKLVAKDVGQYLFDTAAPSLGQSGGLQEGRALNVALRRARGGDKPGGRNPSQLHSAYSSLLGQLSPGRDVHESVFRWAGALRAVMRSTKFMSISSSAMRGYAPAAAPDLGADGQNVSAIVKRLCEDPQGKRRLVDWMTELCAPRIVDIDFVQTDLGDVMLQLVEADGSKISARSLSDGTLRFLGHLVALLSAPPGSILLVEEIENGLHPQRLGLLVQLLEGVTRERNVQVIATSHSPLVLTALSPERLKRALVFGRADGHAGTIVSPLGKLKGFDEIVARRGADRVFSSGWLELAL